MESNMIHTNAGLALLAKLEQGFPLTITRICSGTGRDDDLAVLTELASPKQEFEITGKEQKGPQATIYVRLSNAGLNIGYDLTQIGVFAMDPDLGEILYRVAQLERAIPIPAERDIPDYSIVSQIVDMISTASHVEVKISPLGVVTQEQFNLHFKNTVGNYSITPLTGDLSCEVRLDFPIQSIRFGYYDLAIDGKPIKEAVPVNQPIRTSRGLLKGGRVSVVFYDLRDIKSEDWGELSGQSFESVLNQKCYEVKADSPISLELAISKISELASVEYGVLIR